MATTYTVVDHARRGAGGLTGFRRLVVPRYRYRSPALFANELRMLHHLDIRETRTRTGSGASGAPMLLTVHRGRQPNKTAPLGPVVGSVMLLPPGGVLCTDLNPADPSMAAAVAAYIYDRLVIDRASNSLRSHSPEVAGLHPEMLIASLPSIFGEIGAATALASAWDELTGLSSRVITAQRVMLLNPERFDYPGMDTPAGHAELSGSESSTDDALSALVQDYADSGPAPKRATDLPELSGVLPAETVSVRAMLDSLADAPGTVPVGEVFARSARDLGDRTVLWVSGEGKGVRFPSALAHLNHPTESVIRIGPVYVIDTSMRVSEMRQRKIPFSAVHPALRGREDSHSGLLTMTEDPFHAAVAHQRSGRSVVGTDRDIHLAVVVREAARLALRAGARNVVVHAPMDDESIVGVYRRIGFGQIATVARVTFSPAGTIALR